MPVDITTEFLSPVEDIVEPLASIGSIAETSGSGRADGLLAERDPLKVDVMAVAADMAIVEGAS